MNIYMVYHRHIEKKGVKYYIEDIHETNLLGVEIDLCARHWSRLGLLNDDIWRFIGKKRE